MVPKTKKTSPIESLIVIKPIKIVNIPPTNLSHLAHPIMAFFSTPIETDATFDNE